MENQNNSFNQNNNAQYNNNVPNSNTTKKKSKAPIIIVIVIISLLLLGCLVIGIFVFGVYFFNNVTSNKIQNSINIISPYDNEVTYNNTITNSTGKNTIAGNNTISSNDKVSNHNWKASDNSYLELNSDGTFTWYQDKNVKNDNYYTGSYTIKTGSSAIVEFSEHTTINYSQLFTNKNINMNNYYYLNLSVTSRIIDGEERLTGGTDETHYMLYLYEGTTDTLDGVNLKSMNTVRFTRDD